MPSGSALFERMAPDRATSVNVSWHCKWPALQPPFHARERSGRSSADADRRQASEYGDGPLAGETHEPVDGSSDLTTGRVVDHMAETRQNGQRTLRGLLVQSTGVF